MSKISPYWLMFALRGMLFLVLGICMFVFLEVELSLIFRYLGFSLILIGGFTIFSAVQKQKLRGNWMPSLSMGVFDLALAFLVLFYTEKAVKMYTLFIGLWTILMGIVLIIISMRKEQEKKVLLINGIITLLFGFLIAINPVESKHITRFLLAVYTLILGGLLLFFAWKISRREDVVIGNQ